MKDILSSIAKTLEIVLASPWKAITTIILILILGFGYFFWQDRTIIYNSIFSDQIRYLVNKSLFEKEAYSFIQQNNANVAILWSVNLEKNIRKSLVFQTLKLGRIKELENQDAPVFTTDNDENQYILRLLGNEVICSNLITTSVVGKTIKANGVEYLCRVGIFSPESLLIGYITIGYKTKPDLVDEIQLKTQLKAFSLKLVEKSL